MENKTARLVVLIVHQGFERNIGDFIMDDFRGSVLPNFNAPQNSLYRDYYRIEEHEQGSRCPWGYSRWITGKNGKLEMLDSYYDSSG